MNRGLINSAIETNRNKFEKMWEYFVNFNMFDKYAKFEK
jgi:hypothetical protein